MLKQAPRPPRQSLIDGPSTTCWVAVTACTVDMRPFVMPYFSWTIFASGARQFVVQDAFCERQAPGYASGHTGRA